TGLCQLGWRSLQGFPNQRAAAAAGSLGIFQCAQPPELRPAGADDQRRNSGRHHQLRAGTPDPHRDEAILLSAESIEAHSGKASSAPEPRWGRRFRLPSASADNRAVASTILAPVGALLSAVAEGRRKRLPHLASYPSNNSSPREKTWTL